MSFNLGINVVETDGRAVPSIQPAATSVAGFIIRAERGPAIDKPVMVTNWRQFQDRFGGYTQDVTRVAAKGAYAVRGFFDNGGSTAWITRVFNGSIEGSTPARLVSGAGPFDLGDGGTVTIEATGAPAVRVEVEFSAEPARIAGGDGPFEDLAGTTLTLAVNGRDRTYVFPGDTPAGLDAAGAVAEINREFAGVQAFVDGGAVCVRTDRRGTAATLAAEGSAATILGLGTDTGTGTGRENLGDLHAVTAEEAALVFRAALAGTALAARAEGSQIVISRGATGATNELAVADDGGIAAAFGFTAHEGSDGVNDARTAVAARAEWREDGGQCLLTFTAGYRGAVDPGAWGGNLLVAIAKGQTDRTVNVEVKRKKPDGPGGVADATTVESWPELSLDPYHPKWLEKVLNDKDSGSTFVTVTGVPAEVGNGTIAIEPVDRELALEAGRDDAWPPGAPDADTAYANAIDRFDGIPIQLLCCPESDAGALIDKALVHCEQQGDRMFVGHTPQRSDFAAASTFTTGQLRRNKAYGALYFPWISVANPAGGTIEIPPDGHVLGVYARTERERGVWKAPAGNAAVVNGALAVRYDLTDTDHTLLVKQSSVNAIRFVPGQGIVVDSSRTLSTNPLWSYVNVRLLFNFVKSSLKDGLRWTVQEPNTEELWRKVEHNTVRPFLMGLWRRGAFGPGTPEQVFDVKCDAENNPPANIQQGLLTVEVYLYPSRPAETVVITVGQQEGGGSASER